MNLETIAKTIYMTEFPILSDLTSWDTYQHKYDYYTCAKAVIATLRNPSNEFLAALHQNVFAVGPEKAWDEALDRIVDPEQFER